MRAKFEVEFTCDADTPLRDLSDHLRYSTVAHKNVHNVSSTRIVTLADYPEENVDKRSDGSLTNDEIDQLLEVLGEG